MTDVIVKGAAGRMGQTVASIRTGRTRRFRLASSMVQLLKVRDFDIRIIK